MVNTSKLKYLVIDDEVVENPIDMEDIIIDIGVPKDLALFAGSHDEAVEILEKEKNIVICFLDYVIPKSNTIKYDFEEDKPVWGLNLIPRIKELNQNSRIVVYSSRVTRSYLENEAKEFAGTVTDFLEKPYGVERRKQHYLDAVNAFENIANHKSFNYEDLDKQTALIVREKTQLVKDLFKKSVEDIINIGQYLTEVKQLLKYGQFPSWLEKEIGVTYITAWRMMMIAEKFSSFNLKELNFLSLSAMYELIDADVPSSAIDEVVQQAKETGKVLSVKAAKEIKQKYKQENQAKAQIALPGFTSNSSSRQILNPTTITNKEPELISPSLTSINKQDIVKFIPLKREWSLGNRQQHFVIAIEPNSEYFRQKLPSSVSLCCAFPTTKNWDLKMIPRKNTLVFDSEYQDLETEILMDLVDLGLQLTTNELDNIVVCFIPDPKILNVIDKLGCCAFIADPDREKCMELVDYFNQNLLTTDE
jgi:CheY-like chemotaxis protein